MQVYGAELRNHKTIAVKVMNGRVDLSYAILGSRVDSMLMEVAEISGEIDKTVEYTIVSGNHAGMRFRVNDYTPIITSVYNWKKMEIGENVMPELRDVRSEVLRKKVSGRHAA
jgi:hypothetical protein